MQISSLLLSPVRRGVQNDPFRHRVLPMTDRQLGQANQTRELYQKAQDLATGHNPAAASARPFARRKLGL